jgi:hypothetical protein
MIKIGLKCILYKGTDDYFTQILLCVHFLCQCLHLNFQPLRNITHIKSNG